MKTTTHPPLSLHVALDLGTVIGWASRTATVSILDDGVVNVGTARSIGDDLGNFTARGVDVRDCFLRVTMRSGFERFMPMAEVLERVSMGTMTEGDYS